MEENMNSDHLSVIASVAVTVLIFAVPASAADIYVNSTDDEHNGNCIFECTLRDAILVSNANGEYDRIYVPAGHYILTIPNAGSHSGETGDLLIDSPEWVEIIGEGPGLTVVDGNGIDRVFRIDPGSGNVELRGMTIQGGNAPGSGGGVYSTSTRRS
jgi:CSLREA domain-containing protein